MKAVFAHDTYYSRGPDGEIYAFGNFPYSLWQERFLPHFHQLTIIGREKPFELSHDATAIRSDGPGVRFELLASISTPLARILKSGHVASRIREQVAQSDALIIRGPTEFGMIGAKEAKRAAIKVNRPVAIEMSGCAFDHTWHHKSLTGKIYAPVKYWRARQMVKNADHVIYVTSAFLQRRYPATGTVANASNVDIETPCPDALQKRLSKTQNGKLIFGLIGNYGHNLKGIDVAITALARLRDQIPDFELRILGDGNPALRSKIDFVRYDAPLNNPADVLAWLDQIDVYLQPSRHEGLPRALIEAMSRGCPALASNAGGIPELLHAECIHRKGNAAQLASQILKSLNPEWHKQQSIRNFETAKNYSRAELLPRREKFWSDFSALARRRKSELAGHTQQENVFAEI